MSTPAAMVTSAAPVKLRLSENGIVFSISTRESMSLIRNIDWVKRFANAAQFSHVDVG